MRYRLTSNLVRCDLVLYTSYRKRYLFLLSLFFIRLKPFCNFLSLSFAPSLPTKNRDLHQFVLLCFIIALFICCEVLDRNSFHFLFVCFVLSFVVVVV